MTLACDAHRPASTTGAPGVPAAGPRRATLGAGLALTAVLCVQLGAAASTSLFATVGPAGAAWLRLSWAAVIFIVIARPRPWAMGRRDLVDAIALGLVSAGMTVLFFEAIARVPLATAVACEFLGPLTVAVARRSRRSGRHGLAWPALAGAGVLLVTQPWEGSVNPAGIGYALAAATCWASYILLTQRVGDRLTGLTGLAISMPVAALLAAAIAAPQALSRVTAGAVVAAAGLALLLPVLPYALELLALRRLESAAFGTLMSVEPAAALLVGIVVLGQAPRPTQALGVLLVTAAAGGATRTGRRSTPAAEPTPVLTQNPDLKGS
jgi:inner membrane transporter RhtA